MGDIFRSPHMAGKRLKSPLLITVLLHKSVVDYAKGHCRKRFV